MSENLCSNHAAFRFTWPGKDESFICVDHARQLQGLANEIGLHLQLIPLSDLVGDQLPTELPTCKQVVK